MTLEAKKLGLIQWLANVDDANVIKKIEEFATGRPRLVGHSNLISKG